MFHTSAIFYSLHLECRWTRVDGIVCFMATLCLTHKSTSMWDMQNLINKLRCGQMWIFQYLIFHFFKYTEKCEGAGKLETSAEPVTTINLSALKFSVHSKLDPPSSITPPDVHTIMMGRFATMPRNHQCQRGSRQDDLFL